MADVETVQMDPDIDYEIGQDNIQRQFGPFGLDIHNPVFLVSGLGIVAFVLGALMFPEGSTALFGAMRDWLTHYFAWFFILSGNIFVVFGILLIITPLGNVRLGGKDATPDYTYYRVVRDAVRRRHGHRADVLRRLRADLAFLVLVRRGRRISGFVGAAGRRRRRRGRARDSAMAATIYHWGLHPWAMYAVVALALAFFSYNRGLPLSIRSVFYPIFGDRVWGWPGNVIDTLAVFATLFGLATSLGFGAEQAMAGLNFLFGIPQTTSTRSS